jgi:cytochrome c oxidase cbb3-type subunit I/II
MNLMNAGSIVSGNSPDAHPPDGRFQAFEGRSIDHGQGDRVARLWFMIAVLWFAFFTTFGLLLAIKFFFPTFLGQTSWLTFGVVRPAHVNGVLFGFVSSGLLGGMFYIVPRLCAVKLFCHRLAYALPILWNGSVLAGVVWILLGGSQGREYAELPWAIDVSVMVALVLMAVVILGTIVRRNEKKLYGSLWYYAGTMLWFPIVYFIGNVMWHPEIGALNGIQDAIFNWYYGHNVLGLWFTTLGIPALYYLVPVQIRKPLYSHVLSLIGFFSIAFFYTGVGAHHLLQAPLPEWLKTMAVVMTVLMLVPVLAFAVNIALTMRGSWKKVLGNPVLMFALFGAFNYILASFQGTFQGIKFTNMYLHFSQWPVGHSHIALLGGFGFLAAGLALYVVPKTLRVRIFSASLLNTSWWTASIGFSLFSLAMVVTGLTANADWWVHINVVETLPALRVPFVVRAVTGGMVVVAAYMVAVNVLMTFVRARAPRPSKDIETREAEESGTALPPSPIWLRSQRSLNLPIVFAGGLGGFFLMTFMVVAMPYMFTPKTPSESPVAHELTTEQQAGQAVYKANGCFYCHNQFIREFDWAMGESSEPGDFFYSVPNFLGTERTGPSLGAIGGKRPTVWHFFHYADPRSVSPSSIMPSFEFLPKNKLNTLVEYVQNLGGKNLDAEGFQPLVPLEYRGLSNPYLTLKNGIRQDYDPNTEAFTGTGAAAAEWKALFEDGKALFVQKCLPCHSGSGNGQGPYARQTLARPANLNERISNFPAPSDVYHSWRVNEGVPGTAMPPWGWSLDDDTIWKIVTYETSFVDGSLRTFAGEDSDAEGDAFDTRTQSRPAIAGTREQFITGQKLFGLYCITCHGGDGKGNGPSSIRSDGGYIMPVPANFTESGSDFQNYGRYIWKVKEGVETTNMPPWKHALSAEEVEDLVFYIQGFSTAADYDAKWAPLYTDAFAAGIKR